MVGEKRKSRVEGGRKNTGETREIVRQKMERRARGGTEADNIRMRGYMKRRHLEWLKREGMGGGLKRRR